MTTDQIQKQIVLRAPQARVWRALTDSAEFGSWFGMKVDGAFTPGARVFASITPTKADPKTAEKQQQFEGMRFELAVEQLEPQRLFSFRWHPFAIERGVDYSKEKMTLVQFELEETDGGVKLTVTESGFDQIPLERRAKAFASNDEGWTIQMRMIEKYLANA